MFCVFIIMTITEEIGLSTMTLIKNKSRNQLDISETVKVSFIKSFEANN